jgi:hypothetical protein
MASNSVVNRTAPGGEQDDAGQQGQMGEMAMPPGSKRAAPCWAK